MSRRWLCHDAYVRLVRRRTLVCLREGDTADLGPAGSGSIA